SCEAGDGRRVAWCDAKQRRAATGVQLWAQSSAWGASSAPTAIGSGEVAAEGLLSAVKLAVASSRLGDE
ncbi:hypothetical protein E2562_038327, partial [Oryza meyeriana var. granulata]